MMRNILLTIFCALFLWGCGTTMADKGSGSSVGNPVIVGVAYLPDGTPAVGATVSVRPVNYEPGSSFKELLGAGFDSAGYLYTDSTGTYRGELLQKGDWVVEITLPDLELATAIPVVVDDTTEVSSQRLFTQDTILGTVEWHGADRSAAEILRLGSSQRVTLDSNSQFMMTVPVGVYSLKVVPADRRYNPLVVTPVKSQGKRTIQMIAIDPISTSYGTDTTIVRAVLDSLGYRDVPVDYVTETSNGRVVQLDIDDSLMKTNPKIRITEIPSIICGLSALTDLEIQYTDITTLPDSIGRLTKIRELELNGNKLITLPESIVQLDPRLECNLSGNQFGPLSEPVKKWIALYTLVNALSDD